MLRRKLIFNLGPVIGLMLATAVLSIVMLQGVLRRLDEINREVWTIGQDVSSLGMVVHDIEVSLFELRLDERKSLDDLIREVDRAQSLVNHMGAERLCDTENCGPLYNRISSRLLEFREQIRALSAAKDEASAMRHHDQMLSGAAAIRRDIPPLNECVSEHARTEQEALSSRFRWVVLSLSIAFVIVANLSVVILLHLGRMILRPVGLLIEATRQLSRDNFTHRVAVDPGDEFGELAEVYNSLAAKLQANEQRKMETLNQVALAINHEINNVISISNLQLKMAGKHAMHNPSLEASLKQIQGSLLRLAEAVQMLKNIRRIVLTDYVSGMKMLDLRKSAEQELTPAETTTV